MNFRCFALGACLLVFAGMASQASAQVALGSTLDISVFADADTANPGSQSDSFSDSQGATINTMSHFLLVTDHNVLGSGPMTATTSVLASWVNAGKGFVGMANTGWVCSTTSPSAASLNTQNTGKDIWTYTFMATEDGTFEMNYDIAGTDDLHGLYGASIHWSGPGGGLDLNNFLDPTASGVFSRQLVSGEIYTVGIGNISHITNENPIDLYGYVDAGFNWEIKPVPEPLSIAGILAGLSGLALRKRKQ